MSDNFSRRNFLKTLGLGAAAFSIPNGAFSSNLFIQKNNEILFFVGSYALAENNGIHLMKLDTSSGEIKLLSSFGGIENPSYLALGNSNKFLFAVSETERFREEPGGGIFAFAINPVTFKLNLINALPTGGEHPCHVTLDKKNKFVFAANYTGGNIAVFPILNNGRIGKPTDIKIFSGSGPIKNRQASPHAHSVNLSPTEKLLFVSDLGTDKIMIYNFDSSSGKLFPAKNSFIHSSPGSGPRHLTFDHDGKFIYSLNELNSTVSVYSFIENDVSFENQQNISTLPEDYKNENISAEITMSKDGRFIYASNRGHNSIAVFSVDKASGNLSLIQHQTTMGKTPRHFEIDPTGRFLLAANQDSNNIIVFKIDASSGMLYKTGKSIEVTKPVCIKFFN